MLPVWPDLAKFHHFGKMLKVFEHFSELFKYYLANICTNFGNFYATGEIVIVVNGQR